MQNGQYCVTLNNGSGQVILGWGGTSVSANLAAYDLYLKGRAVVGSDPASLRRATAYYEQAISLDSSFTDAWEGLSRSLASLYANGTPDPVVGRRSLAAAEQVLRLAPNGPQGHSALARYNGSVGHTKYPALVMQRWERAWRF